MQQRPESVAGWIALFAEADIPVLRQTAGSLALLRHDQRQLNASSLANVVTDDPLMTVKLLRYMQSHQSRHQMQELLDVKQVLLMMGLETFFREIPTTRLAEDCFEAHPEALIHFKQTVRRAQRAACYATDWAQRIHNLHAEEVKVSALLTHVSEMLMWCFNPLPMLEIRQRQVMDRSRRSKAVQIQVLGFAGTDLQRQLILDWKLPELLLSLMDPDQAGLPQVRNVNLAVRLARHSAHGWHDAALPDDIHEIGTLLHMEPGRVLSLVKTGPAAQLR
ncbi:MAG: HDOD domain-containing protein [Thiobacillus sp.]|nr:HDOD domain-containing protein [Thiobacillus sp.]